MHLKVCLPHVSLLKTWFKGKKKKRKKIAINSFVQKLSRWDPPTPTVKNMDEATGFNAQVQIELLTEWVTDGSVSGNMWSKEIISCSHIYGLTTVKAVLLNFSVCILVCVRVFPYKYMRVRKLYVNTAPKC